LATLQGYSNSSNSEIFARRGASLDVGMTCGDIMNYGLVCSADNCNYTVAFPPCAFQVDSGDYYLVVTNTMMENLTLTVQVLNFSTPDNNTDLTPNATINGTISPYGSSYLKYFNLTGPYLLQFTNTDPTDTIIVRPQDANPTSCLSKSYSVGNTNSINNILNLPLFCQRSGMVFLETTGQSNFVSFNATLSPLDIISWTDQNCTVSNISTATGSTHLLTQFNTTTNEFLSFTINVNDTTVALSLILYSMDNCSQIQTFNCSTGSYPCVFNTIEKMSNGSYYLFIKDWSSNSTCNSTSFYNLTMSFSYGNISNTSNSNTTCMNISSQLTTCAAYLSPNDYYNLQFSVDNYEAAAILAYNSLANIWPSTCNDSLWSYACKTVFQPMLCNSLEMLITIVCLF
jgi:hypothetical protein